MIRIIIHNLQAVGSLETCRYGNHWMLELKYISDHVRQSQLITVLLILNIEHLINVLGFVCLSTCQCVFEALPDCVSLFE